MKGISWLTWLLGAAFGLNLAADLVERGCSSCIEERERRQRLQEVGEE